jgi:hypothetical protein
MNSIRLLCACLIGGCVAALCGETSAPKKDFTPTASYTQKTVEGFCVLIAPEVSEHADESREALKLLEEKLAEIRKLIPEEKLKPLMSIKFWVEWEADKKGAAVSHHSVEWLKSNGYNPEKVSCVEISNLRHFSAWTREAQPMMILHEVAHIFHHRVLGAENRDIKEAYQLAVKSGNYESVGYYNGSKKRAYALNNASEYFAEISEAYFGKNDFYPFTREELQKFDPAGYALMEKYWGAPAGEKK